MTGTCTTIDIQPRDSSSYYWYLDKTLPYHYNGAVWFDQNMSPIQWHRRARFCIPLYAQQHFAPIRLQRAKLRLTNLVEKQWCLGIEPVLSFVIGVWSSPGLPWNVSSCLLAHTCYIAPTTHQLHIACHASAADSRALPGSRQFPKQLAGLQSTCSIQGPLHQRSGAFLPHQYFYTHSNKQSTRVTNSISTSPCLS